MGQLHTPPSIRWARICFGLRVVVWLFQSLSQLARSEWRPPPWHGSSVPIQPPAHGPSLIIVMSRTRPNKAVSLRSMPFELCLPRSIAWSESPLADAEAIAPGLRGRERRPAGCELMPGTGDKAKPNTLHRTAQPVPGAYMTAPSGRASTITAMRRALAAQLPFSLPQCSSECGQTDE